MNMELRATAALVALYAGPSSRHVRVGFMRGDAPVDFDDLDRRHHVLLAQAVEKLMSRPGSGGRQWLMDSRARSWRNAANIVHADVMVTFVDNIRAMAMACDEGGDGQ